MDWHPFAERFPLLEGQEWESFKASIAETKGPSETVKYRIVRGKKQGLDGRNRFTACEELGMECPMEEVEVPDEEVKAYILRRNVHRRHVTRHLRQELVADLRADRMSCRRIALLLGIDEKTVRNDLSGAEFSAPDSPNVEETHATPLKVIGDDGKEYPASKPSPESAEIPDRLKPFFEAVPQFKEAVRRAIALANLFQAVEGTPAFQEAVQGRKHTLYSATLRTAARALEGMTPARPCPDCGGEHEPSPDAEECPGCSNKGYQTKEEVPGWATSN